MTMMLRTILSRRSAAALPRPSPTTKITSTRRTSALRPFSQQTPLLARKDAQHKDSLKPEPNEYSKSGSDDEAARVEDAAFDPKQTRPEQEKESAGAESGKDSSNPLEVSPANPEVSKGRDPQEGGNEGSSSETGQGPSDRARTSGGGSPDKGSVGQRYSK